MSVSLRAVATELAKYRLGLVGVQVRWDTSGSELGFCPYPGSDESSLRLPILFLDPDFNFISPAAPRSSGRLLPFRFAHQNPLCTYLSVHTFHTPKLPNKPTNTNQPSVQLQGTKTATCHGLSLHLYSHSTDSSGLTVTDLRTLPSAM